MSTSKFGDFDNTVKMTSTRKLAIVLIAIGEFVDGYDLMCIAGALIILKPLMNLDAFQVGLLSSSAFIGAAIGLLIFGYLTDRLGRRKVFTFTLILFILCSILSALITNVTQLFIARFVIGIAIGADIAASMAFLAEISPRKKRGALTGTLPQISWTSGALVSQIVGIILYTTLGEVSWRWMFAIGAVPPFLILLGRHFLPESPRWLLKQGRVNEAKEALEKLGVSAEILLQDIEEVDKSTLEVKGSYLDIFRKPYTWPALLAISVLGFAPLFGSSTSVLSPYIFRYVGSFGPLASLEGGALLWLTALVATIVSFFTIDRIGRMKTLIIAFLAGFVLDMILGLGVTDYPILFMITYVLLAFFNWFSVPAQWILVTELLPTHLRGRANGVGNGLCRLMIAFTNFIIPIGIERMGFSITIMLLGSSALVLAILVILGRKYEPMGKSLEDLSHDNNQDEKSLDKVGSIAANSND